MFSALPIIQSTFQQQRNWARLHKHNICISLHLNKTKDDKNVTENSFKIDYQHTSFNQEMYLKAGKWIFILANGFAVIFTAVALPVLYK